MFHWPWNVPARQDCVHDIWTTGGLHPQNTKKLAIDSSGTLTHKSCARFFVKYTIYC